MYLTINLRRLLPTDKAEQNIMKKYKVGYTCGVFDMFHVGHLNLLERCKAMCDYLIVGVCNDEYVSQIKKKTPVNNEDDRVRILQSLECVDKAVLVDIDTTNDKMLALDKFKFDVLFSGDDWKGSERYNITEKQFAAVGVSIEYLPYTKGISTTYLKRKLQRRVLTFGVFDYFHYGHLKLFEKCKSYGNYLIVAVQHEDEIFKTKPEAQIMYSTKQRLELVSSLKDVDETIVYKQVDEDISKIDFDILAVGGDQNHAGFKRAIEFCKQNNKEVIVIERTPGICSSFIKKSLN